MAVCEVIKRFVTVLCEVIERFVTDEIVTDKVRVVKTRESS